MTFLQQLELLTHSLQEPTPTEKSYDLLLHVLLRPPGLNVLLYNCSKHEQEEQQERHTRNKTQPKQQDMVKKQRGPATPALGGNPSSWSAQPRSSSV